MTLAKKKHRNNKGFQCKQFYVAHDQCPMKVTTDSLMLGSFADVSEASHCLDIGTGSGVLALMMAQKSGANTRVYGIDIDEAAVRQARGNANASPWPTKINIQHCSLGQFNESIGFDVIISNPPYFSEVNGYSNAYSFMSDARNLARLESGLSLHAFFNHSKRLANYATRLFCIYPFRRYNDVVEVALKNGWHVKKVVDVKHNCDALPYVCLLEFSLKNSNSCSAELTIRQKNNEYSTEFKRLCNAFYLKF